MGTPTFPYVARQEHPLADGSRVPSFVTPFKEPDEADYEYAEEILRLHKILGDSPADGTWKWINEHRKRGYLRTLDSQDRKGLARILANFFRDEASWDLITGRITDNPRDLENSLLLDLDTWQEFVGEGVLKMPNVGNPFGITVKGNIISADLPRHDYFAKSIESLGINSMIEIGGGYGGMAYQLSKNITYFDCDLPETLYLAYYFLSKSGRKVEWAIDDLPTSDIILVPSNRKHLIPEAELVFNSNSLSEMKKETAFEYIEDINNKWKPQYFLHHNSNRLLFPSSEMHIEVQSSEFPIDNTKYNRLYQSISPWQCGNGRYREYLYERI